MPQTLGRRRPVDDDHIRKYPLSASTMPTTSTPVILGVNWYTNFDRPLYDRSDRRWWIGRDASLGIVRGGHCVCLQPTSLSDSAAWWTFYDQGMEGACVGFGGVRAMTLIERKRFDARALYREAQLVDDWEETPPEEGTSVRAAIDVMRARGLAPVRGDHSLSWDTRYGVSVNRWALSVDDVYASLQSDDQRAQGVVRLLNSWGREYPHVVYMPAETLARLLREDGEATMFTPS